jgi:hypothetical protein
MDDAHLDPDIARAVRRSRSSRAAMRARRRRSALLIALIAAALAGAGIWSIGVLTGNDLVQAAVNEGKSLAELLGGRSPGERTHGQLTKTKHRHALAKMRAGPRPRTDQAIDRKVAMVDLARLLESPPATPSIAEAPPSFAPFDLTPPTIGTIVMPPPGELPPGSPPGGSPPGGSPPGGTPPGTPPKIIVPMPSAVPEPGTWATMLVGFALIGWRVRSRANQPVRAERA